VGDLGLGLEGGALGLKEDMELDWEGCFCCVKLSLVFCCSGSFFLSTLF
jgi:hypothetical protein